MPALLLAFFAIFMAAAFAWPTWRTWKRERVNAFVLPADDTIEGFVGRWFRGAIIGVFLLLTIRSLGVPSSAFGPLPWLELPALRAAGWAILIASLAWVVVAQAQMGSSWRIGIDATTRPPLVTTGVFALSRNPIFLGMRASLLGLFLVLPNAFSLAILLAGEILMQVQVRLEERHLSTEHQERYERYRTVVRRWV